MRTTEELIRFLKSPDLAPHVSPTGMDALHEAADALEAEAARSATIYSQLEQLAAAIDNKIAMRPGKQDGETGFDYSERILKELHRRG